MTEIRHRAFVHQPNGMIVISNGTDEVIYPSAESFNLDVTGYSLPEGAIALNFESRAGKDFMHIQMNGGEVLVPEKIDRWTKDYYNELINSVVAFKRNIADRAQAASDARPIADRRAEAYERHGLTLTRMVEALFDAVANNNLEKLRTYKENRDKFRQSLDYPMS